MLELTTGALSLSEGGLRFWLLRSTINLHQTWLRIRHVDSLHLPILGLWPNTVVGLHVHHTGPAQYKIIFSFSLLHVYVESFYSLTHSRGLGDLRMVRVGVLTNRI